MGLLKMISDFFFNHLKIKQNKGTEGCYTHLSFQNFCLALCIPGLLAHRKRVSVGLSWYIRIQIPLPGCVSLAVFDKEVGEES